MSFLAAIAVDKRQHYILSADKLQEMVGASHLIAGTVRKAQSLCVPGRVQMVRPVSGEIWVRATNLSDLQCFLFQLRSELVTNDWLNVTFALIEDNGAPGDAFKALEQELQRQKANRISADGAPASPFFARCRIQPELPANHWKPGRDDSRRMLVSRGAAHRKEAAEAEHTDHPLTAPYRRPEQMKHMACGQENSYIALIKADVDGLGGMQMNANWERAAGALDRSVYEVVKEFARAIEQNVKSAVQHAIELRVLPHYLRGFYPVLPLVQAGDDLWLICRREFALQFAAECGARFTALCSDNPVINRVTNDQTVTLSFGVLFAKQGFPLDRQLDLADELLAGAKACRRRNTAGTAGYIDYLWLESSGYEGIHAARQEGGGYLLPGDAHAGGARSYRLCTRPWTLAHTEQMLKAAEPLKKLPTGKLHQLPRILRLGGEFTSIALHEWYSDLRKEEQEALSTALAALPEPFRLKLSNIYSENGKPPSGPWVDDQGIFQTALLELVELTEILTAGGDA
jgi:hypothetical protein